MKAKPRRMALTKTRVDALPAPTAGRYYVYDSKTPGLAVAVTSTGSKAFYLYRWISGRPQRFRIGRWPDVTVEQARAEAQKLTGLMVTGLNPQDAKRAARAEATFGDVFRDYLETYAKASKRTWRQDEAVFNRYLKPLAGHKVSGITQADVRRLHGSIGQHHGRYAANRMVALVSTIYGHAAADVPNPAKGIRRFKETSRKRFLNPAELRRFFVALQGEPEIAWQDFFTVTLLTGARRGNVLSMRWADLNLDRGLWTIPETEAKGGEALICILPPAAVEILRRRHDDNGESVYVFPGVGATGHLQAPERPWRALLKRAHLLNGDGKPDVRIHDLRRTFGSWQAAAGASLSIIGASLGHKNVATTAIYARLDLDPVRASVDSAVEAILAAGNGQKMLMPGRKSGR